MLGLRRLSRFLRGMIRMVPEGFSMIGFNRSFTQIRTLFKAQIYYGTLINKKDPKLPILKVWRPDLQTLTPVRIQNPMP